MQEGRYFVEPQLQQANLSGANLTGAKLSEANLRKSNLAGADFRGASLVETKFQGVDLSQALNLAPEEVDLANIDEKTRIPDYLEIIWISEDDFKCKARSEDSVA